MLYHVIIIPYKVENIKYTYGQSSNYIRLDGKLDYIII